jgi:large subunit ribosomal protein L2
MKNKVPTSLKPEKKLIKILKKHSGRDNRGKISVRHQGGRQKRYYRLIDFKRDKRGVEGTVVSIEYDPNRNCHIALIEYKDGEKRYILHPENLKIGDKIISGDNVEIKTGNALKIVNIPLGIQIHNLELYPGQGGQMIRGAGTAGTIIAKEEKFVHVKLPSGEIRKFYNDCFATVGQVGNVQHKYEVIGKAGRKILMGIRPTVRGTAQNPRSHPHGGGEGKVGEGMHPKTPWGKLARGNRTRKKNKASSHLIVKRRK